MTDQLTPARTMRALGTTYLQDIIGDWTLEVLAPEVPATDYGASLHAELCLLLERALPTLMYEVTGKDAQVIAVAAVLTSQVRRHGAGDWQLQYQAAECIVEALHTQVATHELAATRPGGF